MPKQLRRVFIEGSEVGELMKLYEQSIQLYSLNEELDDIATNTLPWMIVPFYVAKAFDQDGAFDSALEWIARFQQTSRLFIRDPINTDETRDAKVARYKEMTMTKVLPEFFSHYFDNPADRDEEADRAEWLRHWKHCLLSSVELAISIKRQASVLQSKAKEQEKPTPPLKPFVLYGNERQRMMASVFRPGHRLPTMTIDEYYQQHLNTAAKEEKKASILTEEQEEEAERQRLIWQDEMRDAVRRGSGNTYNRS